MTPRRRDIKWRERDTTGDAPVGDEELLDVDPALGGLPDAGNPTDVACPRCRLGKCTPPPLRAVALLREATVLRCPLCRGAFLRAPFR